MREFLNVFLGSFWSAKVYAYACSWRGKIWAYFFSLMLLATLISAPANIILLENFLDHELGYILRDFPEFKVQDGIIQTPEEKIYTFSSRAEVPVFAISASTIDNADDFLFVIEKDKIIFNKAYAFMGDKTIKGAFEKSDFVFDKNFINSQIQILRKTFYIVLLPMVFFVTLVQSSFYLMIIIFACFFMSRNILPSLNFSKILRISILAITPMILLQSISTYFSGATNISSFYGFISITLVWYILRKIAQQNLEI